MEVGPGGGSGGKKKGKGGRKNKAGGIGGGGGNGGGKGGELISAGSSGSVKEVPPFPHVEESTAERSGIAGAAAAGTEGSGSEVWRGGLDARVAEMEVLLSKVTLQLQQQQQQQQSGGDISLTHTATSPPQPTYTPQQGLTAFEGGQGCGNGAGVLVENSAPATFQSVLEACVAQQALDTHAAAVDVEALQQMCKVLTASLDALHSCSLGARVCMVCVRACMVCECFVNGLIGGVAQPQSRCTCVCMVCVRGLCMLC